MSVKSWKVALCEVLGAREGVLVRRCSSGCFGLLRKPSMGVERLSLDQVYMYAETPDLCSSRYPKNDCGI